MKHICTRCRSSKNQIKREAGILLYKGAELPCEEVFTVCNNCGHEFVTAEQSKEWDKLADAAKRHHDNLLSPTEIKQVRTKLKLSQKDAAQVFGGGTNAFSKYERGEIIQSVALDNLLRLAENDPRTVNKLRKYRGIKAQSEMTITFSDKSKKFTELFFVDCNTPTKHQHIKPTTIGWLNA